MEHDLTQQAPRSYVVEVGAYSGEGKFRQWDSDGYYAGYGESGGPMKLVADLKDAYRFPNAERASRIPTGDPRIQTRHRIIPSEFLPNV